MPRAPRLTLAGEAHHIIQRGNNKQAIFFCDADRQLFLADLREGLARYDCALHAYVLMTNHIHLLLTPGRDDAIGQLMQSLGRRYVGHINRSYGRAGTLWEGRFKSSIVDAEDYSHGLLLLYRSQSGAGAHGGRRRLSVVEFWCQRFGAGKPADR